MTVRLLGPYKRLAGVEGDVDVEVTEPNLGSLLAAIAEKFPEAGKKLQPAPAKIEPAVRVIINDTVIQRAAVEHVLTDGDRVAFVPIVGGGRGAVAIRYPKKEWIRRSRSGSRGPFYLAKASFLTALRR